MKIQPMAQNYVSVVLSPDEQDILTIILANDVIGGADRGDTGLAASLNEGIAPSDPLYGTRHTIGDACELAMDVLEGLHPGNTAVTALREQVNYYKRHGHNR